MEDDIFWKFVCVVILVMFITVVGGAYANNSYTDYKVGELIKLGYDPQKVRCAFIVSDTNHPECVLLATQTKSKDE